MAVKRTPRKKDSTAQIVLGIPSDMLSEMQGKRSEYEESLLGKFDELHGHFSGFQDSFTKHRLQYQSDTLKSRQATQKDKEAYEKVVSDLEEAFDHVWPEFEKVRKAIEKSTKSGKDSLSEIDQKHTKNFARHAEDILDLSKLVEKRYQSALKRINQLDIPDFKEYDDSMTKAEIKRLEDLIKDLGKYEYGSSLQIFSAGKAIGFTGQINFKSGFTVTQSGQGIDVTATGGSGGGGQAYSETPNGAVNGSNKVYTTTQPIGTVLTLEYNGEFIHPAEYTVSGSGFTMVTALPTIAGAAFTIVYQGTTALPTGIGINPNDLSSQVGAGNKVFTVTGTISMVSADGAVLGSSGNYTSSYNSGTNVTTITFVNAPQNTVFVL